MQDTLAEALMRCAAVKREEGRPVEADSDARRSRGLLESLPGDDPTRLVRLAAARVVDRQADEHALRRDSMRRRRGTRLPRRASATRTSHLCATSRPFATWSRRVDARSRSLR